MKTFSALRRGSRGQLASRGQRRDLPQAPRKPDVSQRRLRRIWHSCLRRLALGLARWLPDEQRVCLMRSLRFDRPVADLNPEVRLHISTEPELRRLQAAVKEPWTFAWIEACIEPGDVVFDIGANVGAYAIYVGKRYQGQVRVFAFEPACGSYAALCHNIALNHCGDCVTPLPLVLASQSGWTPFRYRSLEAGHALHACGDRLPGKSDGFVQGRPVYEQPMLAMTLDDLCLHHGLPIPQHIKLDVDGAEADVLLGARTVLQSEGLRTLLVELAPDEDASATVLALLEEHGFRRWQRFHHREADRPSYGLFVR